MIVAPKVSPFVLISGCLGAWAAPPAWAGAFLLEPGHWQLISTYRLSTSSSKYDTNGLRVAEKRYGKSEAASLIEYGFDRDLTLLLSPSLRSVRAQGPPDRTGVNIGALDLGARWRIYREGPQIVSFQALTRVPARSDPLFAGENRPKTELRLGYGRSDLLFRGRDAFLDTGLVWAKRAEFWRDELRADLTLGWQRWPGRLVLLQWVYSAYPGATGESRMPKQLKMEGSSVSSLGNGWSLQVGSFVSRGGVATRYERGSLVGLWRKF
ncbi:MAG: hypothetical protein RIQ68_126 [Pseudomonadota bacterium]|jgi:hypothetical protein